VPEGSRLLFEKQEKAKADLENQQRQDCDKNSHMPATIVTRASYSFECNASTATVLFAFSADN
jgi:hypothetical protein